MLRDEFLLSKAFSKLVVNSLREADELALVDAATICWYSKASVEREVSELLRQNLSELELRRLGYLIERFTRFSCMTGSRAKECCDVLMHVLPVVRGPICTTQVKHRIDELAISWGLVEGLGLKVQVLLPYQTRHFDPNTLRRR
ncbi:hypothetical protein BVY10_10355 [Pseudomonas amygdali pv. morsprunorum]|nr:hypothetical protein BVY10_10355 [Pseudomonas amygdali pv. morsprunorum]